MSIVGAAAAAMAATASKLPSPLQVVAAKPVSMTLMLGLFTLALMGPCFADEDLPDTWETPPALETFTSYEDMQRYFDHRNQRRLRHIQNPLKDSYVEAYNQHNEQEEEMRRKRSAPSQLEKKPQPALIKFEVSDAVEPSDEVKQLIRQYKSRELQQNEKYMETIPPIVKSTPSNVISKQKVFGKRLDRQKRSVFQQQQPINFKVKYIPFEVTDAREPDAQTKRLIKRMRALEIERLATTNNRSSPAVQPTTLEATTTTTTTTKKPFAKRSKFTKQWKPKRTRREAAAPEMIKFEISDAKDPDPSLKTFMNTKRESKDLKLEKKSDVKAAKTTDGENSEQNIQASKRYFVFKEAPTKVKKSIAAIPHDVQNIISHLIKGGGGGGGGAAAGGKAYLKYIPAQQMDYNNLKAAYPIAKGGAGLYGHGGGGGGGGYGHGGGGGAYGYGGGAVNYGKYAHAVPVKFVYQPVVVGAIGGHGGGYDGGGGEAGGGGHGGADGVPVKYVAVGGEAAGYGGGGGEAGHGAGGYAGGEGGGYEDGGEAVKYVAAMAAEGGHGGGYGGGGGGYEGAGGEGEAGHAGGYAGGYDGDAYGGGKGGGAAAYVAGAGGEEGYAAGEGGGGHGGGYGGGGSHGIVYGLAHANYAGGYGGGGGGGEGHAGGGGGGAGYFAAHAPAPIVHPIVVAEGGGGDGGAAKGVAGYGANLGEAAVAKNAGNEAIKAIPAPQFKGEIKYSVVPTVEQYAKTPTQDFQLKLYSPESLIAKAQLIAKDQAKAIAEEGQKAVMAAYSLAAAKGGGLLGGGKGGYGGGGGKAGGYGGAEGGVAIKNAGYGLAGGKGGGGYGGGEAVEGGYGGLKGGGGYGGGGGAGPVIKIEYHAPAESFKGNYKEIPEFQQLSALVGKSPEDQIHGLTYLLAKEMQNRLHLQRQHNFGGGGAGAGKGGGGGYGGGKGGIYGGGGGEASLEARPQDNKAPVLFQPQEAEGLAEGLAAGGGKGGGGGGGGGGYYQPIVGKYLGMAKSKPYIPVIEQGGGEEFKGVGGGLGGKGGGGGGGGGGGKVAGNAYGLSPNYKGLGGLKGYGAGAGAGGKGAAGGGEAFNANAYEEAAAKLQSYASKYAFGYRIRDFNTGNDFGHKQNRDLHGVTRGQYHILLPDGRIQNVIYHADDTGFHADVSFESGRR